MSKRDYYAEASRVRKQFTLTRLVVFYLVVGLLVFGWNWNHTEPSQEVCLKMREGVYGTCADAVGWVAGNVLKGVFWPIVLAANAAIWVTR